MYWMPVIPLDFCDSTNDEVVQDLRDALADEPSSVVTVMTTDQRRGRGRLGREWICPPGDQLAISVAFSFSAAFPAASDEERTSKLATLPLAVALAAETAIWEAVGRPATDTGIKWPNDLLLKTGGEWRKAGGILCELVDGDLVVLGVGINLRGSVPGVVGATTLAEVVGEDAPTANALAAYFLEQLRGEIAVWCDKSATFRLISRYRERCITLGQRVRVDLLGQENPSHSIYAPEGTGGDLVGVARDIDDMGQLVLELDADQGTRTVNVGDVHHLRAS